MLNTKQVYGCLMADKTIRITEEAHGALFDAQAPHETFSETILRLIEERKQSK